ncbi:MAG: recombination protein NinB [Pseudomonadota bacterium]
MKHTLTLFNPQQAHRALTTTLWPAIKGWLAGHGGEGGENGAGLTLEVKPATRTARQNRRLHAALDDIAAQTEWAGRRWENEAWKRMLTAAWCRANAEGVDLVPAVDGQGFDVLYKRTSRLTTRECADLLDYVLGWGLDHGVRFGAGAMEAGEARP